MHSSKTNQLAMNRELKIYTCETHEICEHEINECSCNICWENLEECPDKKEENVGKSITVSNESRMEMDGPKSNERRISIDNKCEGNNNLYSSETLCDRIQDEKTDELSTNEFGIEYQTDSEIYPHKRLREGTPEQLEFSFPNTNSATLDENVRNVNEHIESELKKRFGKTDIGDIIYGRGHKTPEALHTSGIRKRRMERIQHVTNNGPSGNNTNECNNGSGETDTIDLCSVDDTSESVTEPCTMGKRRKQSTNNSESESPTGSKQEKNGSNNKSATEKEESGQQYYSWTIHKPHYNKSWISKSKSLKCLPSFCTFDHGDHIHIIVSTTRNNISRARSRIAEIIGATITGRTEILATTTRIKSLWRFILYLLRYGLNTYNHYGTKIIELTKLIDSLIEEQKKNPIEVDTTQICRPYIEERQDERKEHKRVGKEKQKNLTEIILEQIEEHNIVNNADWDRLVSEDLKIQLIREFGISTESYVKHIIKIKKVAKYEKIKNIAYMDMLADIIDKENFEEYTIKEKIAFNSSLKWINYWMNENKIDILNILAWMCIIRDKTLQKINGLVIQGPTNAGKSLLIRTLTDILMPKTIPRENDNSQFKLDELVLAVAVRFEEPLITPNNVGTWKLLLEGEKVTTDIKNKDKEEIVRIPIFITTENSVTKFVESREAEQVHQRIKIIHLKKGISHHQDSYARTSTVIEREIDKPKHLINIKHFAFIAIKNHGKITQEINAIKRNNLVNSDHLVNVLTAEHLQELQQKINDYENNISRRIQNHN